MEFLTEMKQKVLSKYDILTVGETPFVTTQDAIMIANEETGALTMVFQFEHVDLDAETGADSAGTIRKWKLLDLKAVMTRWQKDLENRAWNSIFLSNHDQPRSVSRFGDDASSGWNPPNCWRRSSICCRARRMSIRGMRSA